MLTLVGKAPEEVTDITNFALKVVAETLRYAHEKTCSIYQVF